MRTDLTADITMYVAPPDLSAYTSWYWYGTSATVVAGNDATGNGSVTAPFATPQAAHDALMSDYDLKGKYAATIQLAASPSGQIGYPGVQMSGRLVGQAGTTPAIAWSSSPVLYMQLGVYRPYTLRGDPDNVTRAVLVPGSGTFPASPAVSLTEGASLKIDGLCIDTYNTPNDCIDVFNGSFLDVGALWLGNAGHTSLTKLCHFAISGHSVVWIEGPITITGSALTFMQVDDSTVLPNADSGAPNVSVTITGTPTFDAAFFTVDGGKVYAGRLNISGSIVGRKMYLIRCGRLETGGGVSRIPGTFNQSTDVLDYSVLE